MFHRHRYEGVQRDFFIEPRREIKSLFWFSMLFGSHVTLITLRCSKCGKYKQRKLKGFIRKDKGPVQQFLDEVERKVRS